jgi:hypothetical protein
LGALGKNEFENGFKEKNDFFENLGMGQPCQSRSFMKKNVLRKMVLKVGG